jgi:hypothetical protein
MKEGMMSRNKVFGSSIGLALLLGAAIATAQVPPPPPIQDEVTVTIVKEQPPAPVEEAVVESTRPAPNYIWVPGFWDHRPTGWTWVAGRWDVPPAAEVRWVAPEYMRVERGFQYVPGHWTTQKVITYENGKKVIIKEKVKIKER